MISRHKGKSGAIEGKSELRRQIISLSRNFFFNLLLLSLLFQFLLESGIKTNSWSNISEPILVRTFATIHLWLQTPPGGVLNLVGKFVHVR